MNRVVTLASVVVGTALVMLLGSRFGVLLHPIVVPVTVLVLVVALWLVRGAGTPVMNAWTRDNPAPERLTVDHRLRTYRWAARDLSEAGWDYRIRPTLLAAVEDHLREQGWDPIHAAEAIDLLPLELRPLLTDPHYRPTTQAQLDTVITRDRGTMDQRTWTPQRLTEATEAILGSVETAVVGKRHVLELVLAGILAGGHVLLEDYPGLGKTLAARSFGQALGLEFTRAQFTPDLLPSDLTGSYLYNQREHEFEFRPGPLFTGLLLADEINRTPPKTQAALLEAMQERQVTIEGHTHPLPHPFHVLATANPIEHEGTYPLPEAQLDRFMMRVSFGYSTPEEEAEIVRRRLVRQTEDQQVAQVLATGDLAAAQQTVERIDVDPGIVEYCVALAGATRQHRSVQVGSSPRGSLALVTVARAYAAVRGRDYVVPEDVKTIAVPVLGHRIGVLPELWMTQVDGDRIVAELLDSVPVPQALSRALDEEPAPR